MRPASGAGKDQWSADGHVTKFAYKQKQLQQILPSSKIRRMSRERYIEHIVQQDLAEKMVFVAGPRQVGKTTLAQRILAASGPGIYLSWDDREDRAELRAHGSRSGFPRYR